MPRTAAKHLFGPNSLEKRFLFLRELASLAHLSRQALDEAALPFGEFWIVDLILQASDQVLVAGFAFLERVGSLVSPFDEFQCHEKCLLTYLRCNILSRVFRSSSGIFSRDGTLGGTLRVVSKSRPVIGSGGLAALPVGACRVMSYQKNQTRKAATQMVSGVMTKKSNVRSQEPFFLLLRATVMKEFVQPFNVQRFNAQKESRICDRKP